MSDVVQIRFGGEQVVTKDWLDGDNEGAQALLKEHHGTYPVCLCRRDVTLPLYIAKKQQYYLARMPGTGGDHAPFCPFFDPPAAWTGRAVYKVGAISEEEDGGLRVKLVDGVGVCASSTAQAAVADPAPTDEEAPKKRGKLALRGLLHLIWEQAGLNRWSPRMEGKRNYFVLAKYVGQAIEAMELKGQTLGAYLYMPEPFRKDSAREITDRAKKRLYQLLIDRGGRRKRMLSLAVVKSIDMQEGGAFVRLAHAPAELNLWASDAVLTKFMAKRFPNVLSPDDLLGEDRHLVAMMAIERDDSGVNVITKLDGMWTDKRYLPFETDTDRRVADRLVEARRYFQRTLRFDAGRDEVFPDFLLLDADEHPVPMFVFGHRPTTRRDSETRQVVQEHQDEGLVHWFWDIQWEAENIPDLPDKYVRVAGGPGSPERQQAS